MVPPKDTNETIQNVFKQLEVRFTNPLVFSYCASWFVCNWKVLVILFYYDISMLEEDGYLTYTSRLTAYFANEGSFGWPLFFAFAYTFCMPWITEGIKVFQAYANTWGNNESLKAMKESGVPVAKFVELNEITKQQSETLAKTIAEQSTYAVKAAEMQREKQELEKLVNEEILKNKTLTEQVNIQSKTITRQTNMLDDLRNIFKESTIIPERLLGGWCLEVYNESKMLALTASAISIGPNHIDFSASRTTQVVESVIEVEDSYIRIEVFGMENKFKSTYHLIYSSPHYWIGRLEDETEKTYYIRLYSFPHKPDTLPIWISAKTDFSELPKVKESDVFQDFLKRS